MRKIALAAALVAVAAAQPAFAAGQKTSDMEVTLQVLNSCTLAADETMPFGDLTVISGATATAKATVNCTTGAGYTFDVGDGLAFNSGFRHMKSGANSVAYYIEVGTSGTDNVSGTGTGADVSYDLTGTITSTSAPAGSYSDTVTLTLSY